MSEARMRPGYALGLLVMRTALSRIADGRSRDPVGEAKTALQHVDAALKEEWERRDVPSPRCSDCKLLLSEHDDAAIARCFGERIALLERS